MTSGRYWIETPVGDVLRYTPEIQQFWGCSSPYVDYQVARLLEDIEDRLPVVLEPVPADIGVVISDPAWLSRAAGWSQKEPHNREMEDRWELYDAAMSWWHEREIVTGYLCHGPRLSFWRIGDEVHFRWAVENNQEGDIPVFLVPTGYCRMDSQRFQTAAYGFCEAVLSAMQRRVDQVRQEGWRRTDCHLDIGELMAEQQRRVAFLSVLRDRSSVTDWERVRTHLTLLCQRMDRSD